MKLTNVHAKQMFDGKIQFEGLVNGERVIIDNDDAYNAIEDYYNQKGFTKDLKPGQKIYRVNLLSQ